MQEFFIKMAYKAVVVGGSGLIGRKLIKLLLAKPEYHSVVSLGRKRLQIKDTRLKQIIVDFDHLDEHVQEINGHAVFCSLGTTRKQTPDLNDYRKIDHDYPLRMAEIAKRNGMEQFHLVSAIGANASSSNFYTKMKGDTENAIKAVGLSCLFIYQPSILTGERSRKRFAERLAIAAMKIIDPFLFGKLRKYRSIPAETVAMAMYKQSLKTRTGVHIYASDKIKKRA